MIPLDLRKLPRRKYWEPTKGCFHIGSRYIPFKDLDALIPCAIKAGATQNQIELLQAWIADVKYWHNPGKYFPFYVKN